MIHDWNPEQLQTALDSGKTVFLKLWKEGCGACKLANPAVERLESGGQYAAEFVQISVTDFPEMMDLADDEVLPLFFLFHDKKMLGRIKGFKGIAKLQELLNQLPAPAPNS